MTIRDVVALTAAAALTAVVTTSAPAQSTVKVGTLNCDVSAGVGMNLDPETNDDLHLHARRRRAA